MHLHVDPGDRLIVPDYDRPDALCVPFWRFDIRPTLEAIARAAAPHVGVVLIGPDPEEARAFIASTDAPDHFAVVAGGFDSPWLRDYAPIAVRTGAGFDLVRPRHHIAERPQDTQLFETILPGVHQLTRLQIASGNLVPGPDGLAVSTDALLAKNDIADPKAFSEDAHRLGIRDWLFVPGFEDDVSRHSDAMVRFLTPDLCAVARRQDGAARAVSAALTCALAAARPGIDLLPLEVAPGKDGFTSPLNWIQIGTLLLVPEFPDAPGLDGPGREALRARGFEVLPVPSATQGLGGALRCLTAAVFA